MPFSTIGKLCRHLLTDIKYHGTMLPRIPVPIARDIEKKIADYDRESKGRNGSRGSDYRAKYVFHGKQAKSLIVSRLYVRYHQDY